MSVGGAAPVRMGCDHRLRGKFAALCVLGAWRFERPSASLSDWLQVCVDDPAFKHITDVTELAPHRWTEVRPCLLCLAYLPAQPARLHEHAFTS